MKPKHLSLLLLLCLLGCEVRPVDEEDAAQPVDEKLVLAAVLDGAADTIANDANLKPEPRIVNTAKVATLLALAFEYRVGKGDKMDADWRRGFDERFKAIFEPQGKVQDLDASRRANMVDFLRKESEALRGKKED